MDTFAVIIVIGWNVFVIWFCLKLLKARNDFIDSIGGDSRKPERNIFTELIAEYKSTRKTLKRNAMLAERVRREREENGR